MAKEAYKDHRAGSTKGLVHKRYDEKGEDAAMTLALSRDIKETTVRSWLSTWRTESGTKKRSAAPAKAAKTDKKAATKPAAKGDKKAATKPAPAAKKSAPKKSAKVKRPAKAAKDADAGVAAAA